MNDQINQQQLDQQNAIYSQYQQRYERAFAAFTRIYEQEHPKPPPPGRWAGFPWLLFPFALIAGAGILLSALRTAPVFQQIAEPLVGFWLSIAEAVLALIVIELMIVVVRYVVVLQDEQDGKLNAAGLRFWMLIGFWVAFGVAIAANVYASVKHVPLIAPYMPFAEFAMALAVGLAAPLLAFISGDILGSIYVRSQRQRTAIVDQHRAAVEAWAEGRERRWNARKGDYGLRINVESLTSGQPSALSAVRPQADTDGQRTDGTHGYGQGYVRRTDAREKVAAYLDANPDALKLTVRELADAAGVGKTVAAQVRAERMTTTQPKGS